MSILCTLDKVIELLKPIAGMPPLKIEIPIDDYEELVAIINKQLDGARSFWFDEYFNYKNKLHVYPEGSLVRKGE